LRRNEATECDGGDTTSVRRHVGADKTHSRRARDRNEVEFVRSGTHDGSTGAPTHHYEQANRQSG
jgi:hypothetical protein